MWVKKNRMLIVRLAGGVPLATLIVSIMVLSVGAQAVVDFQIGRSQPLVITVPELQSALQTSARVTVVLGGYDATSIASVDGQYLSLPLDGGFEPGQYPLKVVAVAHSGEQRTLYEQLVNIIQNNWSLGSDLRSDTSYRAFESEPDDFAASVRRLSESALRLQAEHLGGSTQFRSYANFQHRSDANTVTGDQLELADFRIGVNRSTKVGTVELALGNQTIAQRGLVFNGFDRRGISAQLQSDTGRYQIRSFFINTDPEVSYRDNLLVAGSKRERSAGAIFDLAVFGSKPDRLRLGGGYIDGQSQLQGFGYGYSTGLDGQVAEPIAYGGRSWQVSAQSFWGQRSLELYGEYAKANFDSDGFEIGEDEQEGGASLVRVSLNSQGSLGSLLKKTKVSNWALSWQRQEVDDDFYSLANLGLPGDLGTDQGYLQLAWSQVQVAANYVSSENNLNQRTDIATQSNTQSGIQLSYNPQLKEGNSFTRVIGRPSFSAQYSQTRREQLDQDAFIVGYNLDDKTTQAMVQARFQASRYYWSLQHSRVNYINDANEFIVDGFVLFTPGPDNTNKFTTLSASYQSSNGFSIAPSLQWSDFSEAGGGRSQESFNAGISARAQFWQDRLVLDLNYNLAQRTDQIAVGFAEQDYDSEQASLVINWAAIKARGSNSGLKITLRGTWSEQISTGFQPLDDYQVMLGMQLYWLAGAR